MVAPTSAGSLGDQALVQGLTDGLSELGKRRDLVEILVERGQKPQILKTGSLPTTTYNSKSRLAKFFFSLQLRSAKSIVIVGADTLDGSYALEKNLAWFDLADQSASLGIPTSIVSFSFSESPAPEAVARIRTMHSGVHFFSRDPVSKERFERATYRKCTLTADLAFLMQPAEKADTPAQTWVEGRRKVGSLIVGLNVNPLGLDHCRSELVQSYSVALTRFLERNASASVLMVPHDFRDGQSDEKIMSEIKQTLPLAFSTRVFLATGPFEAWDAKRLVAEVDFLVTGRMHLAIAAMGQGIPAFGLAYKGKFEGLMQHLCLDGNLLERERALEPTILFDFLNSAFSEHALVRQKLKNQLIAIRAKSLGNLEKI